MRRIIVVLLLIWVGSVQARAAATTNLLTNPGAESGLAGWTIGGTSNPDVDGGTFDPGINPHSGSFDFYGHTGSFGTLSQIVALVGTQGITTSAIDAGDLFADVSFWEQGLDQGTPSDDGQVTLMFLDASSAVLGTVATAEVDSHTGVWLQGSGSFLIPVGTRSIAYEMDFIRHAGSDNDSFIDDNSLIVQSADVSPVPEPRTATLLLIGCLALTWLIRREAFGR